MKEPDELKELTELMSDILKSDEIRRLLDITKPELGKSFHDYLNEIEE